MAKHKGKMSFEKICRILANQWEEDFNYQMADSIARWVGELKSEVTRQKIPVEERVAMIDKVIEITAQRREEKGGEDYIQINDRAYLTLSAYLKEKSEWFRD